MSTAAQAPPPWCCLTRGRLVLGVSFYNYSTGYFNMWASRQAVQAIRAAAAAANAQALGWDRPTGVQHKFASHQAGTLETCAEPDRDKDGAPGHIEF
jgi:hypothetical protein